MIDIKTIPLAVVDSASTGRQFGEGKIARNRAAFAEAPLLRKPSWVRVRLPPGNAVARLKAKRRQDRRVTVCEEASCPNIHECFGQGTAAFMILGEVCTRRCSFCDVAHGRQKPPDLLEPAQLAGSIRELNDLRAHDVDMMTIGQYLQPTAHHHPVLRCWTPDEFKAFEELGYRIGFNCVASGPLVRSSYHADEMTHAAGYGQVA